MLLVDGHVHIHPRFDRARLWRALDANLAAARRQHEAEMPAVLLLTETAAERAFERLAAGLDALPPDWQLHATGDPAALRITAPDRPDLTVIAGCQIATADGLEVAAPATRARVPDGLGAAETLDRIAELGVPALLPWGFGKWVRGRRALARLVETAPPGHLYLSDSARRPMLTPVPPALIQACCRGLPALAGSDPLDLPGHEAEIGRYGFVLPGKLSPDNPAQSFLALLAGLRRTPERFGRRTGWLRFAADQVRIRRPRDRVPPGWAPLPG